MVKFPKKKTGKRKAFKTNRKKVAKPTRALKAMVKREIARNMEDKTRQTFNLNAIPIYGAGSLTTLDASITPVTPWNGILQIDQGTGQGDRIGNRIKIKNLTMKGSMFPAPYNATNNNNPTPVQVKLYIFYDKRDVTTAPTPAFQANFFQNSSSVGQFSNTLVDLWRPINTDIYKIVYTKTFKLGYAVNTSAGSVSSSSGWANNDFKLNCNYSVNLTKYAVKNVIYNDNNSVPSSRALFAMFYATRADGTQISAGQLTAYNQFMLSITYEDA